MNIIRSLIITFISITSLSAMDKNSKIYVAGHRGLVGSAIVRTLHRNGYTNIITRTSQELDLRKQQDVEQFFQQEKPEYLFLAAAKVGGILANKESPADFLYDNIMIEAHVIHASYKYNVKKLLFLGSSCIYPKLSPQPIKEEYLLTGPLESTNEGYAIAKIAGIELCKFYNQQYGTHFISCMPTNLYGPGDNFDLRTSHVLPALIRKFIDAKDRGDESVTLWGTGAALREFLHVDDCAHACLFLMNNYNGNYHVNIGTGKDISIKDVALKIKNIVCYQGELVFDNSKPDGTPRKLLDVTKLSDCGWVHRIGLDNGIKDTVKWYLNTYNNEGFGT